MVGGEERVKRAICRQPCGHICSGSHGKETEIICGGGAYLDQILALSLGDERLKLGRGEGVNQARLRHDQQQNLGACQDGQFVRLQMERISWLAGCVLLGWSGKRAKTAVAISTVTRARAQSITFYRKQQKQLFLRGWSRRGGGKGQAVRLGVSPGRAKKRTFFMMPALRLEKVMWRRDLSLMNLISILRRSRPPFSSSSSSSSAAGRGRLTPRPSFALPLPTECASSSSVGDVWSCWSVMSAMLSVCGCNCDSNYKMPMPILIRIQSSSTCITRRWKRQRVVEILL